MCLQKLPFFPDKFFESKTKLKTFKTIMTLFETVKKIICLATTSTSVAVNYSTTKTEIGVSPTISVVASA